MRNAVIEFPSYEVAVECWHSPEYQQALKLRQPVSTADLVIIEDGSAALAHEHHQAEACDSHFTQQLVAEPSAVFPLLCPVREADWIDGWDQFPLSRNRELPSVTACSSLLQVQTTQSGTSPVTSATTASWKC